MMDPELRRGLHPPNFGKRYPAEVLTPNEIRRLLQACPNRGPSGMRNRALYICLWRGGLRIGEALALYPKDVDPVAGTITVLHGKGNKRRTIGLDPQAMAVLERWLDKRAAIGLGGRVPLFCTISQNAWARPLRAAYVRSNLKRLAAKAGIEKRVHPHGLRHTFAYELANEGTPLHLIQAQLGHDSLATTDRYVRHIAPVALVAAMRARSWPDELHDAA